MRVSVSAGDQNLADNPNTHVYIEQTKDGKYRPHLVAFGGLEEIPDIFNIPDDKMDEAIKTMYSNMADTKGMSGKAWMALDDKPPNTAEPYGTPGGGQLVYLDACLFPFSLKNFELRVHIAGSYNIALCRTVMALKVCSRAFPLDHHSSTA